ncbi:MAG: protein-glutamate O-methyltransferase [Rhodospirillales bacterium]|jgi:chemotaxis protein methyltransferase CheR|nr:protein-glutamate O-methyltransferase [Rhodospirillales bacterium]
MTPEDFKYISTLIKGQSGLTLTEDKAYLLESRLLPVARKQGMESLEQLIAKLKASNDRALITDVTEAMTTNESFFFRDQKPFDLFRDILLPEMMEKRAAQKSVKIWCAAASSGQEPYTISILLKEAAAKLAGWNCSILGTDISHQILAKAKAGVYSQFEVQRGMPITMLVKYFDKMDDQWQIKQEVKNAVTYKYFNLLDSLKPLGRFDIVFCRNVLIYFDPDTKAKVLSEIADILAPDGMVILGGAETVLGISDRFAPVPGQRGVYKRT